mgnify:FL=1
MAHGEDAVVKKILQKFVRDTIPEYILEGSHAILDSGGVQKLDLKKRSQFWDVDGQIQGDDFQVYASEIGLNLEEQTISYFCNCPDSFSGVCRHIGATALKLLKSLDTDSGEEAPKPRTDWRQTFRTFFSTELEPEPGKHYYIFRFYPEPGRLQVALFRGRQNKGGISNVQTPVTLEQVVQNPD